MSEGNRTAAAELLGLSRQSLYEKLGRYELEASHRAGSEPDLVHSPLNPRGIWCCNSVKIAHSARLRAERLLRLPTKRHGRHRI